MRKDTNFRRDWVSGEILLASVKIDNLQLRLTLISVEIRRDCMFSTSDFGGLGFLADFLLCPLFFVNEGQYIDPPLLRFRVKKRVLKFESHKLRVFLVSWQITLISTEPWPPATNYSVSSCFCNLFNTVKIILGAW